VDKYLYVAMTGASQNALAQKAHANNLANISTNGFQKDLEQARSMPVFGDSFPARAFAMTERPATDFSPGSLVPLPYAPVAASSSTARCDIRCQPIQQ